MVGYLDEYDKLTELEQLEFDKDRIEHELECLLKEFDKLELKIDKLKKEQGIDDDEQLSKLERLEKEYDKKAEQAYSDWKYGSERD